MRIVLLTQYYRPEMGAPQSRLFEMLRGLKALGAEVSVVTALPNYPEGRIFKDFRGRFALREERDGIALLRFWLYASNSRRTLPRILSMLSFSFTALFAWRFCRQKQPDLLVVESPPLTLALTAWLLAKASGARMVTNVSDLWPLSALELGALSRGTLYRALERLERFVYRRSAGILGQSQEIVTYIRERGFGQTFLFRNGVDYARFRSLEPAADQGSRKVVYAGLLGVAQGILGLCRALDFRALGLEFHIYGAGAEKEELEAYLAEHPERGIYYGGVLQREEIPGVLVQHHAALIPLTKNIYGAVPSKIYEAMAAGLPILFSGEGEGARIVAENDLGWVNRPGDLAALKENFARLAEADLAVMRSRCRHMAATAFNRPVQVQALHRFLEAL